jgi:hypothetical protein
MRLLLCAAWLAALGAAADRSAGLLAAAAKGRTEQVKSLLDGGANLEAAAKDGRTPLMLAAQHGRLETVRLLLARGAKSDARDSLGFTAWGLAMFSPVGHDDREGVLKTLPQPRKVSVGLLAWWSPAKLASSCFLNREQLVWAVRAFRLDSIVLNEFARYASSPAARGLMEIGGAMPLGMRPEAGAGISEADVMVNLEVQPGAACSGQGDNLTLAIDVSVVRARDHKTLFQRSFAGGVKGLGMQTVDNPRQYEPVWEAWLKPRAEPIYWAVAAALARSVP